MYSTAFWCLFVVLLIFLALLRNRCYSFHRTKWRLVTSICRGPGPAATRMPFFSPKFKSAANFSAPAQEENLIFLPSSLGDRLEKRSIISPTNRAICAGLRVTSGFRPVPVTTYTTGARTHVFTVQEPTQHENGDLRKIKVCVNLRKVGHPTLRKLSTARKGL